VHDRPQAPQWEVVVSEVSQPAAAVQSPKPALQAPCTQALDWHDAAAFGYAQMVPHMPQFWVSFVVLVSQPFERLPSHEA
jgi:hypothetical protein